MGAPCIIAAFVALAAFAFLIACVVAGSRYDRARDQAWAEFGRTHPLLVSRDVPPLHSAPSTPAAVDETTGMGGQISSRGGAA